MHVKVLVLLSCSLLASGAKILGIFHNPSYSHFNLGNVLLQELARRGHEVTMIGPFAYNSTLKNYEVIEIDGLHKCKDDANKDMKAVVNGSIFTKTKNLQDNFRRVAVMFLEHPKFKAFLNSSRSYDLVMIDWIFNEAFLGIAHHFKAHSVVFNSFSSSSVLHKLTSNPAPASYVSNILPPVSHEMTFFERLLTAFGKHVVFEILEAYQKFTQNRLLQAHFPGAPHVEDLYHQVSLVLINSYLTIETPRPYVPNMIPVGGFHIPEPKPLQGDLKILLDEATEGVIYCSFGTIHKSSALSRDKVDSLIKTFAKLPLKVLWKFETDDLTDLPPNVKTAKWFPQNDLLGHPNVKLFISQGGVLSLQEAMHHGVPLVAVPFLLEQEATVAVADSRGIAKWVPLGSMSERTLTDAIKEVLYNPRYKENMQKFSAWFKDRPVKPLDTAVYWIEYVLKYDGAHHLKTGAHRLTWYQHHLLDVFGFVTAVLVAVFFILKTLVKLVKVVLSKKPVSKDILKKNL